MAKETKRKIAVVAIGGNSLIKDEKRKTVEDQYQAAKETTYHIADMIEAGWDVAIGHGNGPQVGFILRRVELALGELHPVPLDSIGADTQGALGYMIQQQLGNEFRRRGMPHRAVSVVTQVRVDADDPAFGDPTKPIGSFMDEATARKRAAEEKWDVKEEKGRGWRRVVASPEPKEILELDAIRDLVGAGYVVIAVGGGGIPVVRGADGNESEPTDGVAPRLPPVHPAPGDVFSRREVGDAMRSLAAEYAALWSVESVGVEPEVEVRDGAVVDLTFVVHRP